MQPIETKMNVDAAKVRGLRLLMTLQVAGTFLPVSAFMKLCFAAMFVSNRGV